MWLNSTVVAQAAAEFVAQRSQTIADFIPAEGIADVKLAQDPVFAQVRTAARAVPLLITVPLIVGAVVLAVGIAVATLIASAGGMIVRNATPRDIAAA